MDSTPRPFRQLAVRWLFARLYHEFAWAYDAVAWAVSRGEWVRWVGAAEPWLTAPVLELACGTGHLQLGLARSRVSRVGVDRSRAMLRVARRRLHRAGVQPTLARADVGALPFAAGSFASVVATFPTDYILAPRVSAEVRRVLRPDGVLVVVDAPSFDRPDLWVRAIRLAARLTGGLDVSPAAHHPYATALTELGWDVETHTVATGRSSVRVLVGRMPPAPLT